MKPSAGTLIKPGHPNAEGLVFLSPFNGGNNPLIYDYAPGLDWDARSHGTIINGATWVPGLDGPAVNFVPGSSQYIDCGSSPALDVQSFTIAALVKLNNTPSVTVTAGGIWNYDINGRKFSLAIQTDRTVRIIVNSNGFGATSVFRPSTDVLTVGVWYLIFGVYNAALQTLDLYIFGGGLSGLNNGALVGAVPASIHPQTGFKIGAIGSSSIIQFMDGKIGYAGLWNYPFIASQVNDLNNNLFAMFEQEKSLAIFSTPVVVGRLSRYQDLNGLGGQGQMTWNPLG